MSGPMTRTFVADARRRWPEEEKQAIIEESKTLPVSRVAKKHGVATSLLFRWRKQQGIVGSRAGQSSRAAREAGFVRVALPAPVGIVPGLEQSGVEIVLANGTRLIAGERTDLALLKRVIAALS